MNEIIHSSITLHLFIYSVINLLTHTFKYSFIQSFMKSSFLTKSQRSSAPCLFIMHNDYFYGLQFNDELISQFIHKPLRVQLLGGGWEVVERWLGGGWGGGVGYKVPVDLTCII